MISIKNILKAVLFRPCGVRMGKNSRVDLPRRISHPDALKIGENTRIHRNSLISALIEAGSKTMPQIIIGNNVYVGLNVVLACKERIVIADGCVLSDSVFISDTAHGVDPNGGPILEQPLAPARPVIIKSGAFVGRNVFIAPGVTVGEKSVIGAGSIVTKSVPDKTIVGGNPARPLKKWCEVKCSWEAMC